MQKTKNVFVKVYSLWKDEQQDVLLYIHSKLVIQQEHCPIASHYAIRRMQVEICSIIIGGSRGYLAGSFGETTPIFLLS